jgi:hypothetical protein
VAGGCIARQTLAFLLGTSCAFIAFAPAAHAVQEWPETPSVTCDRIVIDPPTWIKVTFTGTMNGTPFERSAFYGGDGSHDAHIGIGDLTAAGGRIDVVVTATSKFFGTSHTARVTIDCPTQVQGVLDPGGAPPDSPDGGANAATAANAAGTQESSGGLLPFTGANALRLVLAGLVALVIGIGASRVRSRRRQVGRAARDDPDDDQFA